MQFNKETTKEIINSFVEIYGENYRIDISNKINNCLILLCGYKDTNKLKNIYNDINQKYRKLLYDKISNLIKLSENDFEYLFGNNILSESSQIMAFGSSSQYIINKTPKTKANEINTKEIIKVRNTFYNNSNINEITTDLADKLIEIYDEINNQAKKDFKTNSLNFEENQQILNQMNFLEKPNFNIEFYNFEEKEHNEIQPNFIKNKDGNIQLYPIISFQTVKKRIDQVFNSPDYFDILLIHEINHAIGMNLKEYRNYEDYTIQMGMTIFDSGKNTTQFYKEIMIDEIFNQRIAKKITNSLHKKGFYLIDNPTKSKVEDSSLYEMAEFIIDDFLGIFEKKLLSIYITGTGLKKFYEEAGIENVNELGELVNEYLNNPDILDVTEEINQKYRTKADIILNRIKDKIKNKGRTKLINDLNTALCILDINDLKNLNETTVLSAYESIILKYGLDNNNNDCLNQIKQSIVNSYKLIINNLDVVKNENSIETNSKQEKLYGIKKTKIFGNDNIISKKSTHILITKLFENNVSPTDIIVYLNLLEHGLATGTGIRKMIGSFGEDICTILFDISKSNDETFNENIYQELQNKINSISESTKTMK